MRPRQLWRSATNPVFFTPLATPCQATRNLLRYSPTGLYCCALARARRSCSRNFKVSLPRPPTPTNAGRKTAGSAKGKPGTTKPQQETKPDPLREYQEKFAQDAQGALNELGVAAVSGDQSQGYRIDDVSQSAYLSRSGLQTGDVILSVNGRQVGNLQQDKLELANIVAQGSARIEVRRGSRRFFITASLK